MTIGDRAIVAKGDFMGCIYPRGTKLWIRFKSVSGKWTQQKTGLDVGQETKARKLLLEVEANVSAGKDYGRTPSAPITVAAFAARWLTERAGVVADWKSDQAKLRYHILPAIGALKLDEVRPRHLVDLIRKLRGEAKLAPKTIYNVYSTLKALFRDAKIADLLTSDVPTILTKYQLGAAVDKDPEWRPTARYTRDELEILISDSRISLDRRVFYALEGIAGMRLGEVAGLRFRHYDPSQQPLGAILIATSYNKGQTKTKMPRRMPVHPTLAAILAEWKLSGWAEMMGRQPTPDDLVVPLPPEHATRRREGRLLEGIRNRSYCFKRFRDDLKRLGFRHRRGHDLRRTMVSLSREDGARKDILELCTHNPRKSGSSIDVYTTFPWEALCREVEKLVVRRHEPEHRAQMRAVAATCASDGGFEDHPPPVRPLTPVSGAPVLALSPGSFEGAGRENLMISRGHATDFATADHEPKGFQTDKSWRRRESKLKRLNPETRGGMRPWPVSPRRWLGR